MGVDKAGIEFEGEPLARRLAAVLGAVSDRVVVASGDGRRLAWLGLEQVPGAASVAAGWSWNGDGAPLAYTNWEATQPDDGNGGIEIGSEQCARSRDGTDQWFDELCTNTDQFACAR